MTSITERIMRGGEFSIDLAPNTPRSVIDAMRAAVGQNPDGSFRAQDGHVVVTPGRIPPEMVRNNLGLAYWSGRLFRQDGVRTFSGKGLASWLGDPDIPSTRYPLAVPPNTRTLATVMADVAGGSGLSVGSVQVIAGNFQSGFSVPTRLEYLTAAASQFGAEWRINPNGSIDLGTLAYLYPATPRVMFSHAENGAGSTGIRSVRATLLSPTVDSSQRANATLGIGPLPKVGFGTDGVVVTTPGADVAIGLDGTSVTTRRVADLVSTTSAAERLAQATRIQALWVNPRTSSTIAVPGDRWRFHVRPGELVYVSYPEAALVNMAATPFEVDGRTVHPMVRRIQQVDWEPSRGDGIYLVPSTGSPIDLTDWNVYGSGAGRVAVGVGNGAADDTTSLERFEASKMIAERAATT